MPRSTPGTSSTRSGTLRIGDQWNAIKILAQSQANPLKAVCEIVENAIDAGADQIEITRRRQRGQVYLEVADNGRGVLPNANGEPDFARIATHVCDSMKRHLGEGNRAGVHGEFGIGMLSFWSLGEALRMISGGADGSHFEMELRAGKKSYVIRPLRGRLALGGTRVVIGPLFDSARKTVTGDRLVRYLASELRDRIRNSAVTIQVVDRMQHKTLAVRPQEFLGEPITGIDELPTEFGPLRLELYLQSGGESSSAGVAICKDGTRVLRSVTDLEILDHSPWSENLLEGIIDYPALSLAPGTRSGIVPDERLSALLAALRQLEPALIEALQTKQKTRTERASAQILKQLKKAFVSALRGLPSSEYLFFDLPPQLNGASQLNAALQLNAATLGDARRDDQDPSPDLALPAARPAAAPSQHDAELDLRSQLPFEPGPLHKVAISPKHPRARPGEDCTLRASAQDDYGRPVRDEVDYAWQVIEGNGSISPNGNACRVRSEVEGVVVVSVTATADGHTATAQAPVKFLAATADSDDESPKGLPTYRISAENGKPWRSRYDETRNEIVINSAHRDFAESQSSLTRHRRYIGKLYAKEVVLINFPHESPATVMERLIELTLRTEENL